MGFFLLLQQLFKSEKLLLHIGVNLEVARNYTLHSVHIVINISFLVFPIALQTRNQLSFLGQQLGCLLEVLQVFVSQLVLLVDDIIYLFVESEKVSIHETCAFS